MRHLVRQVMELEDDIEVVGEACDACNGARCWAETRPDVMIVDYRMPGHDGLDLAEHILSEDPGARILMFSSFLNDAAVDRAETLGVSAIVPKDQVRRLPALARGHAA
jgi:DNA-binding NarL/FixJ family response regulator